MYLDGIDVNRPDGSTEKVSRADDYMRETRQAIVSTFGIEHHLTGEHKIPYGAESIKPLGEEGQLFINTQYGYIEQYQTDQWVQVATLVDSVLNIPDLPSAWTGKDENVLIVDETNEKMIFIKFDFIQLKDVPSTYIGQGGKHLRVKTEEDGLEFSTSESQVSGFLDLDDTPSTYSGQAGLALRVNTQENALEFYDPAVGSFQCSQLDGCPHSYLDFGTDDHHAKKHELNSAADHAGSLAWTKVDKAGSQLSDIQNVTNTPEVNQYLKWNGTNWVTDVGAAFPSGTIMYFGTSPPPAGWTMQTGNVSRMLWINSTTGTGGTNWNSALLAAGQHQHPADTVGHTHRFMPIGTSGGSVLEFAVDLVGSPSDWPYGYDDGGANVYKKVKSPGAATDGDDCFTTRWLHTEVSGGHQHDAAGSHKHNFISGFKPKCVYVIEAMKD